MDFLKGFPGMRPRLGVLGAVFVLSVFLFGAGVPADAAGPGEPPGGAAAKAPYNGPVWKPSDGMKGFVFRGEGGREDLWKIGEEKNRVVTRYLKAKYKMGKPPEVGEGSGIYVDVDDYGAIRLVILHGEMKVPGFKMKGNTDDDYRAAARAFLIEEKELFGLVNVDEELKETEIRVSPKREEDRYGICCRISYQRYVEGIIVKHGEFGVALKKNGIIRGVDADILPITPDMREAAKRFKTEGLTKEKAEAVILADYEKRKKNLRYEILEEHKVFRDTEVLMSNEAPYVVWVTVYGGVYYIIDGFTGRVIEARILEPVFLKSIK